MDWAPSLVHLDQPERNKRGAFGLQASVSLLAPWRAVAESGNARGKLGGTRHPATGILALWLSPLRPACSATRLCNAFAVEPEATGGGPFDRASYGAPASPEFSPGAGAMDLRLVGDFGSHSAFEEAGAWEPLEF